MYGSGSDGNSIGDNSDGNGNSDDDDDFLYGDK